MTTKLNDPASTKKNFYPILPLTLAALSIALLISLCASGAGQAAQAPAGEQPAGVLADPVTVITVTSGTDPDDSPSKTCYTDPLGPPGPPTPPCTLRRAIVEASALDAASRPILIRFDIPADAGEGYDSALGIWKIQIFNTTDTVALGKLKDGQIIIDGSTQPGGRTNGPKIIIVGPTTGAKDGLVVGEVAGDDGNEIRGLGFQNLRTHLYVNTANNLIEDNWFGLDDEGTGPYLRNDDPEDGSGSAGVALVASAANNLIQNNVFLGFDGVAAVLRGDANTFTHNWIGTLPDGSVPGKQTQPSLICTPDDWLGGGGLTVQDDDQIVTHNRIAGLRQEIFSISTQPAAIMASGAGHSIEDNEIGLAEDGSTIGVCGRGIYLTDGPEDVEVLRNTIVESGMSAISLNGALYDANLLRSNTIRRASDWPELEGSTLPEDAIQMGKSLPDSLELFVPAAVTQIHGTQVSGTNAPGFPCPSCVIEVFLDDKDTVKEALQSLGVTTADANGDWTLNLPAALGADQGLRTTSTTAQFNTIANISKGTTSGLSDTLYLEGSAQGENMIFLPLVHK